MINVGPKDVSKSAESSEMEPEEVFLILSRGELELGGVGWRISRDMVVGDCRERPYPMQADVKVYMYVNNRGNLVMNLQVRVYIIEQRANTTMSYKYM